MPREHSLLNQHVVINGCRIAAGVHGSGIPLVLVHGTPAHTVIWQALVPLWVDAGFQVHLYDLPGYGASERPLQADTSVAAQVAFLHDLLDHWQLEKTHLFGHDIGGAIALRLALDEPQRLLTLTVADAPCYDSWPSPTWRDMRDRYAEYALTPASEHRSTMTRQLKMAVFNKPLMAGERLEQFLAPSVARWGRPPFISTRWPIIMPATRQTSRKGSRSSGCPCRSYGVQTMNGSPSTMPDACSTIFPVPPCIFISTPDTF